MKICFFSIVTYWHGIKGGMDLHGKHLLYGLSQRGHQIHVISTTHPDGKSYEEINGIKFHYLKNTTFGSSRKGWGKESIKMFKQINNKEKIDIVISQANAGYAVVKTAKSRGVPFVTIMHGYETMILKSIMNQVMNFKNGYGTLIKSLFSWLYYSLFQEYPLLVHSTRIIAVSHRVAEVLARRPLVQKDKIKIINYGIDLNAFNVSPEKRKKMRNRLGIADENRVIFYLSLISKQKGADIALKAFSLLSETKNLQLIIGGDGEYLEEAKYLAKRLGIDSKVIFTGLIANESTADYYNAADIFIFPTLRVESFGLVIAEAMACGKPVIASRIGSIPGVIDDGINGILVPPGDFRELAAQIKRILEDHNTAKLLSENAWSKALSSFGLDKMIEDTINICESAIAHQHEE